MTTRIDHKIKKDLGISLLEYCVLDNFRLKPKQSIHAAATTLNEEYSCVESAVQSLRQKGLLIYDTETKAMSVVGFYPPQPRVKTTAVTINGEKQYSLHFKLKLHIIELKPDYQWSGIDAKHTSLLISKLKSSFKNTQHREATDDDIITSFDLIIACIPRLKNDFWLNWDVKLLNSEYNKIISAIKNPINKIKFVRDIQAIASAVDDDEIDRIVERAKK